VLSDLFEFSFKSWADIHKCSQVMGCKVAYQQFCSLQVHFAESPLMLALNPAAQAK